MEIPKTGVCSQCDLSKANFRGADLAEASHKGAGFWQAQLGAIKGVNPIQFD